MSSLFRDYFHGYYCVIIYLSSKFSPSHCSTCSGSSATCAPCGICQYRSDSPEGPCRKFRDVVLVCVHIWASLDYVLHMLEMRFGEIDIISPKLTDEYLFTNKSHGRLSGNSNFSLTKLTALDAVHTTRNQFKDTHSGIFSSLV